MNPGNLDSNVRKTPASSNTQRGEAGTVKSYDAKKGRLVVKLDSGETLTFTAVGAAENQLAQLRAFKVGERVRFTPTGTRSDNAEPGQSIPSTHLSKEETRLNSEVVQAAITVITLIDDVISVSVQLTPECLRTTIVPYLEAIAQLQHIIDNVLQKERTKVIVRNLSQNSPISISLEGAVEATEAVRDMVVPWRREHAKEMSELTLQEKAAQLETIKAEVEEIRARTQKEHNEAKKIESEANIEKLHAQIEKMQLENEKLRLEIEEARINLALKILDQLGSNLPEGQRIFYILQLLKPLGVLTTSPLQPVDSQPLQQSLTTGIIE